MIKHMLVFYSPTTERVILDIDLTENQFQLLKDEYKFSDEYGCYKLECYVEDYAAV